MQDLRLAFRMLAKAPALVGFAVLLIALAMGLNTAFFSVLYAGALRPLPYGDSHQLVSVFESERERHGAPLTPANFDEIRHQATGFVGVTGYRESQLELSGIDPPQRVTAVHGLENFFSLLGVAPLVGRTFGGGDFYLGPTGDDGIWDVGDVAVLDYGFWQSHYGGSRGAIGSSLPLNDKSVLVIGVMPEGFGALWREADVYIPWILPPDFWSMRPAHVLLVIARRADGVSIEAASSEVDTIYARLAVEYPETNEVLTAAVEPLRERFAASTRTAAILSVGAVLLLLVACANLAGLLATRARARAGEVAVRRALGATRGRIARQLVTESTVIVVLGGIAGFGVARLVLRLLALPALLPFSPELNLPVLGFSFLLLAGTTLVLGLAPAWLVTSNGFSSPLRELSRARATLRMSSAFVVVQVAIALGLVSTGAVLLRSLGALERESLGLDAERVHTLYVSLPEHRYRTGDEKRQFRRRALEALRTIPGVSSVDTASQLPTTPTLLNLATAIEGQPSPRGTFRAAPVFVSHGLLRTLRVPIRRGRDFDERDSKQSPWVIVINERMAREFWPGQQAVGRRIRLEYSWAPDAPLTVIGVVPDVKQESVGRRVRPSFYILHEQFPQEWFYFALRTERPANTIATIARARLAAVDASLPVSDLKTMEQRVAEALAEHRARTRLFALYATAGLVLAMIGLYGTLASLVSLRTRELVVRMALGASRTDITRLVLGHGMKQLGLGIVVGLALALVTGRFVANTLYEADPTSGVSSLPVAIALLVLAGVAASLVPTYRAVHLDLAGRLRGE